MSEERYWYCPQCNNSSDEKVYDRHNGYVSIFVCPSCHEENQKKRTEESCCDSLEKWGVCQCESFRPEEAEEL